MKKIGVLLSGCGFLDGAEIRESVLTLLALDKLRERHPHEVVMFAPNIPQHHVVDHLVKTPVDGQRNVLAESARIARGNILDLAKVNPSELAGLIMPGGYGVAKNLCSFAFKGAAGEVNPAVRSLVEGLHASRRPIGAVCIAPALVALVLGRHGVEVTIGNDRETAAEIAKTGARHQECEVHDICVDATHKVVSTPAYMFDGAPMHRIGEGIEKCVAQVLAWA